MEQVKEMFKRMGFKIVVDEMKTTEWSENDGFLVVGKDDIYHRIDYVVDSYSGDPSITSVKEVKPKVVTKVEYV